MRTLIALLLIGLIVAPAGADRRASRQPLAPADFAREVLRLHNEERVRMGAPALAWSDGLSADALFWARELARRGTLEHAPYRMRGGAGENLFAGTARAYALKTMIGAFIAERRDFVPGRFPDISRTGRWEDVGHYTQMIWAGTRQVGCAQASGGGRDVLVCRYWPAGNIIGDRVP
jgi:uncharacterized protein YkwD